MGNESKNYKAILYYLGFLALGFLLLVIYKTKLFGFGVESFGENGLLRFLSKELGMALVIAIVLVFTIEKVTRRQHGQAADRLMAEINKDIFRSVYKRYIPPAVFDEVEKCLLTKNVFRKRYQLCYTLRKLRDQEFDGIEGISKEEHLALELYSSYVLENTTDTEQVETIGFAIEIPNEPALKSLTKIKSFKIDDEERVTNPKTFDDDCTAQELYVEFEVEIPARGKRNISMEGFTVKRSIDGDSWASRIPSNGVQISVVAPENCMVDCKANHSEKLVWKNTSSSGPTIWQLDHGIFPHQSVTIWWNCDSATKE